MPAVRTVIAVPCYNEEHRLSLSAYLELATRGDLLVLFVDDGSTDGTRGLVEAAVAGAPGRLGLLSLPHNSGKAEAVRRGLREGLAAGADIVGFLDADGATPPLEMLRLRAALNTWPADVVIGSRLRLLGRDITRRPTRHYLGRVLATFVSQVVLEMPVYDTQCGAKVFRRTPALETALAAPFTTTWVFDVELIGRMRFGTGEAPAPPMGAIVEEPLLRWTDVPGSKIKPGAGVRALIDLCRLARMFRRARRRFGRPA
jgi:glycosyltransferase involved in cell wall biosynthesis